MTIEKRDTARAIQTIARKLREPARIDWERERYELAKAIYIQRLTLPEERMSLTEEGDAEIAIEMLSLKNTNVKPIKPNKYGIQNLSVQSLSR